MSRELFYGVSEQERASIHRLDDARVLLAAARWRGSMHMAGYAVECCLKAKLIRIFDCSNLSELDEELQRRKAIPADATIFTHQLEVLLRLIQGINRLRKNEPLWRLFNVVNRWVPAWRYAAVQSKKDDQDAADFVEAVAQVVHSINHNA